LLRAEGARGAELAETLIGSIGMDDFLGRQSSLTSAFFLQV
jgi:hypothetical protein